MKVHIFLVDEERDELKIFLEAISGVIHSFKCTYASSGEQALEMLRYLTPDFIFVDFNLPMASGNEVLSAIKRDVRLKQIPVFLYSTHFSEESRNKALAVGASGCIERPGTIRELTEKLKDVMQPVMHV